MKEEIFYTNEEKLNFIIKHLKLNVKEIDKLFGTQTGYVSKLRNHANGSLKPMHLYAFNGAYDIPYKIFKDKKVNTPEKIIAILEQKEQTNNSIFKSDELLLNNLLGTWYAYFYPSNTFANIHSIKTTITNDYRVSDEHDNHGELFLGERQSTIIKKSHNSKNFVSILFDNDQVAYKIFPFSMVSKTNQVNREMCNFGFYSRKQIELDLAKKILGDISGVQLKMDCDFKERVAEYALIED